MRLSGPPRFENSSRKYQGASAGGTGTLARLTFPPARKEPKQTMPCAGLRGGSVRGERVEVLGTFLGSWPAVLAQQPLRAPATGHRTRPKELPFPRVASRTSGGDDVLELDAAMPPVGRHREHLHDEPPHEDRPGLAASSVGGASSRPVGRRDSSRSGRLIRRDQHVPYQPES